MSRSGRRPQPGPRRDPVARRSAADLDALLDGGTSGDPRLDTVFSAARAPATPHELRGTPPALPALSDQDPMPVAPSRSVRVRTRLGAAGLLTKAAAAAAGVVVVGAAAAGATGHLPGLHRDRAPVRAPASSSGPSGSAARSDAPSSAGHPSSTARTTAPTPSGASTASALPALCRAWLALPPGSDAVRRGPRFAVLVRAAGGVPAVSAFCRELPTRSASGAPTSGGSSGRTGSPSVTSPTTTRVPSTTRAVLTPTSVLPSRSSGR